MEDPQRPLPHRSPSEHMHGWVEWFGLGRIVGAALAMVLVCAGAYWLVRTPPPPTEALIPHASSTTVADSVVLTTSPTVSGQSSDSAAGGPAASPSVIAVHVAGAVVTPGVYELGAGTRVDDALAAAGGSLVDADPNSLNLAAVLTDGSRVYVPRIGEEVPSTPAVASGAGSVAVEGTGSSIIDVNEATAVQLDVLPGVGPATAAAIVAERERNGPFLSVDDLDRVAGVGPAKVEALRDLVTT